MPEPRILVVGAGGLADHLGEDRILGGLSYLGRIPTPANAAIVETVHAITRGDLRPDPALLGRTLGHLGATPGRSPQT